MRLATLKKLSSKHRRNKDDGCSVWPVLIEMEGVSKELQQVFIQEIERNLASKLAVLAPTNG